MPGARKESGCASGELNTRMTFKADGLKSIRQALEHIPETAMFQQIGALRTTSVFLYGMFDDYTHMIVKSEL